MSIREIRSDITSVNRGSPRGRIPRAPRGLKRVNLIKVGLHSARKSDTKSDFNPGRSVMPVIAMVLTTSALQLRVHVGDTTSTLTNIDSRQYLISVKTGSQKCG